jgi:hypothetical protein
MPQVQSAVVLVGDGGIWVLPSVVGPPVGCVVLALAAPFPIRGTSPDRLQSRFVTLVTAAGKCDALPAYGASVALGCECCAAAGGRQAGALLLRSEALLWCSVAV